MSEVDLSGVRDAVRSALLNPPQSGDEDFDNLAVGSLTAAFNRLSVPDLRLPTEGRIALEVSAHSRGHLPAHEHALLEGAFARAVAFVGAAIAHPDADVSRLTEGSFRQATVYARPTPTGAIAFLPERDRLLPGFSSESIAEQAMARLVSILPAGPEDRDVGHAVIALRQPELRAVGQVAHAAKALSGLSLLLRGGDEVVRSTVTSSQAHDLEDFLADSSTRVERLPILAGHLDGMRFSRQVFFFQSERGREYQGLVDVDLIPLVKELLDRRVQVALERVVRVKGDGTRGRASYRLVGVDALPPEVDMFDNLL